MWFEVVLFLLLQPGLLLTIPPVGKQVFMSGKTSMTAIVVHALIFAAIIYFKSSIPILRDIEGFAIRPDMPASEINKLKFADITTEIKANYMGYANIPISVGALRMKLDSRNTTTNIKQKYKDIYPQLINKLKSINDRQINSETQMNMTGQLLDYLNALAKAIDDIGAGKNVSDSVINQLLSVK